MSVTGHTIYPAILVGGAARRLWPLSDADHPKWDLRLFGAESLLEMAWARARSVAPARRCLVVASAAHARRLKAALPELHRRNLLLEPVGRDTAGAVSYAAGVVAGRDPEGVLLALPSDHLIHPLRSFARAVRTAALAAAQQGALATLGVKPREAATCYGYIHRGSRLSLRGAGRGAPPVFRVRSFKEKPSRPRAEAYCRSGEHYWNSGIFIFPLRVLRDELETQLPAHAALVRALAKVRATAARKAVMRELFLGLPRVAIDFGVMEKARRVVTVEAPFDWDDVGSWSAVAAHLPRRQGQALGPGVCVLAAKARDNLVVAPGRRVALVGVNGLALVEGPGGLLVCRLSDDQLVRNIADCVRQSGQPV
jgi:mannose-1-phosphate guanylyltransferase